MPGLAQRNDQLSNATSSCYSLPSTRNGSVSSSGFWSKHSDDISYHQLQKFWGDLPPHARLELLRIDKQTLFEQARKNMYCSRCNGLLLEGFLQIVMYGKSLQQDTSSLLPCYKSSAPKGPINGVTSDNTACQDEMQDPSIHPWGGLATTRDGALTLLDCYLYAKSLKDLQNVFDSARARERERELLYPDACGGGGRGWISQGMVGYGRGHGTRETCALHTARLSCDTLVDFWSALGDETQLSLLRMKEEDFIDRLMYRFDSKRFCRDCRRNVIREFKELKELKRMKREPRCNTWYCVADTAFHYEVSNNTIHADWHQTFIDSVGTYDYFEWAVGTGEGKADILDFKNVGMEVSVQVKGLDLGGLNACYITLRAWKPDGRCTELSVKAHALEGQRCVHYRLMVGDGYVTISHGENIREFFEHAEEAEEEEDDDSVDKDGNELDSECSRPQKHAKSPELAREFLLDAAMVIFKEQVEKAFREGTARQNAHSIFVCLALKVLEERVHVACKEIITLEKQMKLLEEEEKEKRQEEERKEKKRTKEREKKLRRKERLREKGKEKNCTESDQASSPGVTERVASCVDQRASCSTMKGSTDADTDLSPCVDVEDELTRNSDLSYDDLNTEEKHVMLIDESDSFTVGSARLCSQKMHRDFLADPSKRWPDRNQSLENNSMAQYSDDSSECSSRGTDSLNRQRRCNSAKFNSRNPNSRFNLKESKVVDRNDLSSCGCNKPNDYTAKVAPPAVGFRVNRENRSMSKLDSPSDVLKAVHRGGKTYQSDYVIRDSCGRIRTTKYSSSPFGRELLHTKKVWEPVENQKRYPRSNSDSNVTLRSSSCEVVHRTDSGNIGIEIYCSEASEKPISNGTVDKKSKASRTSYDSKDTEDAENDLHLTRSCKSSGSPSFSASSNSSSDSCSSCLSEGDSNTAASSLPALESSSTSDSEDGSPIATKKVQVVSDVDKLCFLSSFENLENRPCGPFINSSLQGGVNGKMGGSLVQMHQNPLPQIPAQQNSIQFPTLQGSTTMGYYNQNRPVSWSSDPANGFVPYVHPSNHYLMTDPFGYSFSNGDSTFCMQYGAVQHLPSTPMLNPTHVPVYQTVLHTNGPHFSDQRSISANIPNGGVDPSCDTRKERLVPLGHQSMKEAVKPNGAESGSAAGFSLFKFGGPLALSAYNQSSKSPDEWVCGDPASDLSSSAQFDEDSICRSEKDSNIEEYTLFAASTGIRFSIF